MIEDEVLREIRTVRETFAASHGYDIRDMIASLNGMALASGREVVRFAPRPPLVIEPNAAQKRPPAAVGAESVEPRR